MFAATSAMASARILAALFDRGWNEEVTSYRFFVVAKHPSNVRALA
jgi:hypothetical protein